MTRKPIHSPSWYFDNWLKALREGPWKHQTRSFRTEGTCQRCAFGVLHEVIMEDESKTPQVFYESLGDYGQTGMEWRLGLRFGQYYDLFERVTAANDMSDSFDRVIGVIEKFRKEIGL